MQKHSVVDGSGHYIIMDREKMPHPTSFNRSCQWGGREERDERRKTRERRDLGVLIIIPLLLRTLWCSSRAKWK